MFIIPILPRLITEVFAVYGLYLQEPYGQGSKYGAAAATAQEAAAANSLDNPGELALSVEKLFR